MKRIVLAGCSTLIGLFVAGCVTISSASAQQPAATRCATVRIESSGNRNIDCSEARANGTYVKVFFGGRTINWTCTEVSVLGRGRFGDANCTKEGGVNEYIGTKERIGTCFRVWVIGSGEYNNDECEVLGGVKNYIVGVVGGNAVTTECAKTRNVGDGKFNDNECTESGVAKNYIEVEPARRGAAGRGGNTTMTSTGVTVKCTSYASTGEISSEITISKVAMTFHGCQETKSGTSCTVKSVGAGSEGLIITKTLKGEFGEVGASEAASLAGLLLEPATGKIVAELEKGTCGIEGDLEGKLAAEVTPVDSLLRTVKVVLLKSGTGEKIKHITVKGGSVEPKLLAFGGTAGEETTDELLFEEGVEIA